VIVDEGDEVAPDFTPVQSALALSLEPIEEGLRSLEAFENVAQRRVVLVAVNPFRQAEIEHGIQPEKDCVVFRPVPRCSVRCSGCKCHSSAVATSPKRKNPRLPSE